MMDQFLRMSFDQPQKRLKNFFASFCQLFREHDLSLTLKCNSKVLNFQDVTLNLENLTYRPYLKDNEIIIPCP